jgi:hypothetical protein
MVRTATAICLLQFGVLWAVSNGASLDHYGTDWLTPPVHISNELSDVSAMDLAISKQGADRWTGTITLYRGKPVFNAFGDADKGRLQSRKLPVAFRAAKPLAERDPRMPPREVTGELYELAGPRDLAGIHLVLNSAQPADCRLLIMGPEGYIARVLPLQSDRLRQQAERYPPSNPLEVKLKSDFFVGQRGLSLITISGNKGKLIFEYNRNNFGLDRFGNLASTTMVAFQPWPSPLQDLQMPDPTGQNRRLFRCDLGPTEEMKKRGIDGISADFEEAFLVLHPREGGWHRLVLKGEGQADRVLPMYSDRLRSWLRIKAQLTDATEQQVFARLSQELPYFSGLTVKDGHVRGARIQLPEGKEAVLDHLADFPHLDELDIRGDVMEGDSLERFSRLERLRISQGRVTPDALRSVGRLTQLTSLIFYTVRLDCSGLAHLTSLRKLTHFAYTLGDAGEFVENYDDSCVSVFSTLPELQHLELQALPLSAAAVASLPTSEQITHVGFRHHVPFPAVLKYSQSVPTARIDLGGVTWRLADGDLWLPRSVTNADLSEIAHVPNLHSLTLEDADSVTDEGLAHLRSLKLKHLKLPHNRNLTDVGMSHVAGIKTLESLNLWYCEKLTNDAIDEFKRLPNLKKITLTGTQIDRRAFQVEIPRCQIDP